MDWWQVILFACIGTIIGAVTVDVLIRTLTTVYTTGKKIWDWYWGNEKKAEDDVEMAEADDDEYAKVEEAEEVFGDDFDMPAPISIKEMPCPHCGKTIGVNVSLEHSEAKLETSFQTKK